MRYIAHACVVLAALVAPEIAIAAKRGMIDCEKVNSLRPGMSGKQITKVLGRPYSMQFSRNAMVYGWPGTGTDRVVVAFDVESQKVDARRAALIWGSCGGAVLEVDPTVDPRLSGTPKKLKSNGTALYLAYAAENRDAQARFVEYIPRGQSLTHWGEMIAVFMHMDASTPSAWLEVVRKSAKETGNPHFKHVYMAPDGSEAIAALPTLRNDSTEYQIARWVTVPGGVRATVYFSRSYDRAGLDRDVYVAREEARIDDVVVLLKSLPPIMPPDLLGSESLILTGDGTVDGTVLVPDEYWPLPPE